MRNKLNEVSGWTVIGYDQNEFPFDRIIEEGLLNFLAEKHGTSLNKMEDLHLSEEVMHDLESARQEMFRIFRGDEFQTCYKRFAKFLIDTYADQHALVQKTPTARIQPPHFMTTSFHSDAWYGHSQRTNSFWLPVTEVDQNNTLNIAPSRETSSATMMELINGNHSLQEINEICMSITEPTQAKKGQVLTFAPDMIHGAKMNTSERTRVSFDFRIVNSDEDLGFKPISNYYSYSDLFGEISKKFDDERAQTKTHTFLSYSNYCSGVNPKSQLMLCSSVAEDKGISIQRNESEIYIFDHLPVLRHYLGSETPTFDGVVAFSIAIFNGRKDLAEQILNLAKENSKKILFAAEDILFSSDSDNEAITRRIA